MRAARPGRYTHLVSKPRLASDSDPWAERRQVAIWRSLSPFEKAQLTRAASRGAAGLAMAGLRSRYPEASPRELEIRMARLLLGDDLTRAAYPGAAEFLGP